MVTRWARRPWAAFGGSVVVAAVAVVAAIAVGGLQPATAVEDVSHVLTSPVGASQRYAARAGKLRALPNGRTDVIKATGNLKWSDDPDLKRR